jgi:adenylate kinase
LIHYYSERRKLLTVDGMMTIEEVTREISRILQAIGAVESKASKKAPPAKRSAKKAPARAAKSAARTPTSAKKPAKTARKVAKRASAAAKKGSRKAFGRPAKKVTKRRAKA